MIVKTLTIKRAYFDNFQDAKDFQYEYHPFSQVIKDASGNFCVEFKEWTND